MSGAKSRCLGASTDIHRVYKMWTEGPAMKELRRVRAPEWMLIIDLGRVTSHAPRLGASL